MSTAATALKPIPSIATSAVSSLGELTKLGSLFAQSRFFADATGEAQAVVKILAGAELGISPIAAMTGIYIVKGRISLGANLMAAKVKESQKYDYRVVELSTQRCEVEFFERRNDKFESIGKSEFTIEDARKAGTQNLDKFSRNMLFARAMSNGCKWFCPDIFTAPIYTPDELGATVNEEGDVIDISLEPQRQYPRAVENRPVEAVVLIDAETQRAIKALWTTAGYPRPGETTPQPLAEFLTKNKGVDSLENLTAESGSKLLELLQKRALEIQHPEPPKAEPGAGLDRWACGDRALALDIIQLTEDLEKLGVTEEQWRAELAVTNGQPDDTIISRKALTFVEATAWRDTLKAWIISKS